MDILCVIPARGGSKRVPGKNIAIVGGKPLLAWTIEAAIEAGLDPYVSTEDDAIADVAVQHEARVLRRPLALAADDASTEDALINAMDQVGIPKWVVCLPPTSPLRTADTISRVVQHATAGKDAEIDCYMTVTEYRGDLWGGDGKLRRLNPNAPRRQQDRTPMWEENSAVYMTRSSSLWMSRKITGYGNVVGITISRSEAWDINDQFDMLVAEALITERHLRPLLSQP